MDDVRIAEMLEAMVREAQNYQPKVRAPEPPGTVEGWREAAQWLRNKADPTVAQMDLAERILVRLGFSPEGNEHRKRWVAEELARDTARQPYTAQPRASDGEDGQG